MLSKATVLDSSMLSTSRFSIARCFVSLCCTARSFGESVLRVGKFLRFPKIFCVHHAQATCLW